MARQQIMQVKPDMTGEQMLGGAIQGAATSYGSSFGPVGGAVGSALGGMIGQEAAGGAPPSGGAAAITESALGDTAVGRRKQSLQDAEELQKGLDTAANNPEMMKSYGPMLENARQRAIMNGRMA